jgi:hypothetical protein
MSGHTKEPWAIFGAFNHIMGIEYEEAQRRGVPHAQWTHNCSEEDARRIVACVNALQGVPTDWLEKAADLGINDVTTGNLFSARLKLQQQRDKLLAALKALIPLADFGAAEQSPPYADKHLIENAIALIAEIEASK